MVSVNRRSAPEVAPESNVQVDEKSLYDLTTRELIAKFGFYNGEDIEPEDVRWLWEPYIPAGMMTLIEGDPGVGKSWLTCMLAACISRGWALPGSTSSAPGNVFMMSGEDSLPHVMVPRLKALGADLSRISFPNETFKFDSVTLKNLADFLRVMKMAVVFVDPVQHYMGGERDINKANEVREFLNGLNTLAMISGCAMVLVRHLRKAGGNTKIYRGLGSIDFVAAARSSLQVTRSPYDPVAIIEHVKCNVGPLGSCIGYQRVEDRFEWVKGVTPVEKVKVSKRGENTGRAQCERFLIEHLKDGPKMAKDLEALAVQAGLPLATLAKVKMQLVRSIRETNGWRWELKDQTGGE
jgi:hypothetical protein